MKGVYTFIQIPKCNTLFDVINFRQQILQYLNILRETSETEKRKMSKNVYAALYKLKINYDLTEFLRKKRKHLGVENYIKFDH